MTRLAHSYVEEVADLQRPEHYRPDPLSVLSVLLGDLSFAALVVTIIIALLLTVH